MKKLGFLLLLAATLVSCQDRKNEKNGAVNLGDYKPPVAPVIKDTTTVQLIDTLLDFGTITEGEKATFNFRFKNTGNFPLVIMETVPSCGCTIPEKPEEPIKPGDIGIIKVEFNSKNKTGHNDKHIVVKANVVSFPDLHFTGEVKAAKQ
jgi:Protein of unknown function (DUF1573)